MICIKCGGTILDGCCTKCGYLTNGNKVEDKNNDRNYELKLYNKDFNKISMNKNLLLITILGPLYFSYMGHFFLGTILVLLDYFYIYYSLKFFSIFNVLTMGIFSSTLQIIFIILINRLFYIIFSNSICLSIDKYRIKRIKKKYKDNYIEKLKSHKHHKYYLILTILLYVIVLSIIVIIKRINNGLI